MAMTNAEAGAAQSLLRWLTGHHGPHQMPRAEAAARMDAAFLADRSRRPLMAGMTGEDVHESWPGDLPAEVARLRAQVQRVLDAHPHEDGPHGPVCGSCIGAYSELLPWPCPTIRALDGPDQEPPKVERLPVLGSLCEQDRHDECGFGERCVCLCHQGGPE